MNITIDTEKLWDFVRDAYEEAAAAKTKDFYGWHKSEARKQVEQSLTVPEIDWAKAREELED